MPEHFRRRGPVWPEGVPVSDRVRKAIADLYIAGFPDASDEIEALLAERDALRDWVKAVGGSPETIIGDSQRDERSGE